MILTRRFSKYSHLQGGFRNNDFDKEIEILILDRNERDESLHLAILCKEWKQYILKPDDTGLQYII